MSITSNLYTGAAGLNSHSDAMNIISDNIANVNTVGFKNARGNFSDILGNMIAGSPTGAGSRIGSVQVDFSQGALVGTSNATDLAIRGEGFFMVNGSLNGVDDTYYTRNGGFTLDPDGFVVTNEGLRLQGYGIASDGSLLNTPQDMQVIFNSIPPRESSSVSIDANLDAAQAVSAVVFDPTDPGPTSDYSTAMTVYDSLGTGHQLEIYFKKSQDVPNAEWDYHVMVASNEIDPPGVGTLTEVGGGGTLVFDTDGALNSYDLANVSVDWAGAQTASVDLDLGTGTATGGSGLDGITTYNLESTATFLSQDGFSSGNLAGLSFDEGGIMYGVFSNGQQRALGQVSLARFANNEGLDRRGGSVFASTRDSGSAVVGHASAGGLGTIASNSLESSNVDLARQFVDMITIQRGFQSNSRSITTADEMLNEILTLKR